MVGSALVDVCGSVVSSLTRSVVEHLVDADEDSRDSIATSGYDPLESTGLEWNYGLVDEFIYEEYGEKEVTNAGYAIFIEGVNQTRGHWQFPWGNWR